MAGVSASPGEDRPGLAISSKLASATSFALMAASAKAAGEHVESYIVVLARSLIVLVFLYPLMRRLRIPMVGTSHALLHLRCLFGTLSLHLYYYALQSAPLGEVVVLANTAPLFVPLLGLVFLGERPRALVFPLLGAGFLGVVLIAGPGLRELPPGLLAAASTGLFVAAALICLKKLTTREHPLTIVFVFSLWTLVTSLPPTVARLASDPRPEIAPALLPLVLVGLLAFSGQFFLMRALSFSAAGAIVVLNYLGVVLAFLIGLVFWGEEPSVESLAGAGLIIASSILASRNLRRLVT